jgi:cysteinyl-tRNA synthetase
MLTVNGTKMSKSLGNVFSPEQLRNGDHELLEKGFSEMVVRFFILQSHYASTLDFSSAALSASEKGYEKLMKAIETLGTLVSSEKSTVDVIGLKEKCYDSMNDDFNTPILIANLFEGVKMINTINDKKATISASDLEELKTIFEGFVTKVLGLKSVEKSGNDNLSEELMGLFIKMRKEAKETKNYALADEIRNGLSSLNITLKDTKEGTGWEKE